MKQLRVKMYFNEVQEIVRWVDKIHNDKSSALGFSEMSALATLIDWKQKKLEPKMCWYVERRFSFTLQAPVCLALLHFSMKYNEPVTSYVGYLLHELRNNIYQVFIANQLP